jgi:outer membrane protein assembly factor BamB
MGVMLPIYALPVLCLALVVWAVATRGLSSRVRRASLIVSILIACSLFTLIRTGGVTGDGDSDLHWRWTPSPEERLLARAGDPAPAVATPPPAALTQPATAPGPAPEAQPVDQPRGDRAATPSAAAESPDEGAAASGATGPAIPAPATAKPRAEWPGFRGPGRDGVARGIRIGTDWSRTPPVEVWRRPIGPGWSSFAVDGDLVYTQEQRGEQEVVSCYLLSTGEPVWRHGDPVRFWESNAGAGPRGTPTVHDGRVYALGATGILNALDARTGAKLWSRNIATDTGVQIPDWGIASSPLVHDGLVIVAASGRLAAYDARGGEQRWLGPEGGAGYSSPHLVTLDGVPQIVLLRGSRTISVAPADGSLLWEHTWQLGVSIVQPAVADGGDLLITTGDAMGGMGIRRLAVARGQAGWTVDERWTSRGLKPYFNDFVVHDGHAFGFDGSILSCIDLRDGARKWKGGRYGHGQLVLLPDQDVFLVVSEEGEVALVKAAPDQFTELARIPALENKTWNHPAIAGDLLLVRNGEEMVAFRLPRASS